MTNVTEQCIITLMTLQEYYDTLKQSGLIKPDFNNPQRMEVLIGNMQFYVRGDPVVR